MEHPPRHCNHEKPVAIPAIDIFTDEIVVGLMIKFQIGKSYAQISALLANGIELQSIPSIIGLTEGSVRTHTKRLYERFNVHHQSQLVAVVYKSILESMLQ